MQCPNCSKEIHDTAKVCGYCGHRLQIAPSKCPECGNDKREGAKVCGYCGYNFVTLPQTSETNAEPVPPVPAKKVSSGGKFPGWTWGLIAFFIVAVIGGIAFISSVPEQDGINNPSPTSKAEVPPSKETETPPSKENEASDKAPQIIPICRGIAKAKSNRPIELHYGFWGALKEYYQENFDHMDFRLYIDGERYYGKRIKDPLQLSDVPCIDLDKSKFNTEWKQRSLWMYDILEIDSLSEGEHQIEVIDYLDESVYDGMLFEGEQLIRWGPGEVLTDSVTLIIEP